MIKKRLHAELKELKRALVIYLKYYMPLISPTSIIDKQIQNMNPDEILTFNYTSTYTRYGFDIKKIVHLHGDLKTEKIVLGYEDLDESNLTLIDFKKYFQRIENMNTEITEEFFHYIEDDMIFEKKDVFIYGLSLDKTDEDIINIIYKGSEIFNVYYLDNDEDYALKVTNLIAILGKETFLKGYHTGRIVFCKIE